ncbi:MAG TPA: tetratricopeptide repeat protein [Dehalococcoidia bacterium]|nr:tetratricopeptide repeat protein [Dehalococcoidia bacterium]
MRARTAGPTGVSGNVALLLGAAFLALALFLLAVRLYVPGGGGETSVIQNADPYGTTNGIIAFWEQRVRDNPGDFLAYNNLADGYIRRARETGDVADYGRAEAAVTASLGELAPENNYTALTLQASLHNVKHDFDAARQTAKRAVVARPNDPFARTILGDALLALGRYDQAFVAYRELVEDAPGLASFSRMAHIHELRGELDHADVAWQNALNTDGGRRPENTAWARVQYGHFLFTQGKLDEADRQYESALEALPGYVHAIAGQARLAASHGQFGEAIGLYSTVVERQPVLEYVIALGDVYRADGRNADAQRQYDLVAVIDQLYKANGINTDLESALFLADHGDPERAVVQATAAYQLQPGSIRAADVLSWALYKAGRLEEAVTYSEQALRLGTKDALLLFHAGMINNAAGNDSTARDLLSRAVEMNPAFSVLYSEEAVNTLEALEAAARR